MRLIRSRRPSPMWRRHELRDRYDVVVVGGGAHGLAIAYELATRGIRDVAVLERAWIGSGASGRNNAIVRATRGTPAGVAFAKEALERYERLSKELDDDSLFSRRGLLELAHTERDVAAAHEHAEVGLALGVDSRVIYRDEIASLCPPLDLTDRPRLSVVAALSHPPAGVVRHDGVVWAYARNADQMGVHLHQDTAVTGVDVRGGRVTGARTGRGDVATGTVISAAGAWTGEICGMAGVPTPLVTFPRQAFVTEPLKPFLDAILVSDGLGVSVSQTDRGEVVVGGGTAAYPSSSQTSTLDVLEAAAAHTLELLPALGRVHLMRAWSGLGDLTPDGSPIVGLTHVGGFLVDGGWGSEGIGATPAVGAALADLVHDGAVPDLIAPFALDRFRRGALVREVTATAVTS
jgi:sarcosine oxidase subunit beta